MLKCRTVRTNDLLLEGRSVILRPILLEDTPNIVAWRNTPFVRNMLFSQDTLTPEQHEQWMRNKVATGQCAQFIIVYKSGQVAIGTTFLKDIDRNKGEAEFGIFIGESAYLGKGAGTEATKLIVQYGFKRLELREIYLRVLADNDAAIKSYIKVGFEKTSIEPHGHFRNDQPCAIVKMRLSSEVSALDRLNKPNLRS